VEEFLIDPTTDRSAAWQATVRGHLTAARDAVPKEGQPMQLERIAAALAALDEEARRDSGGRALYLNW
jgi:hypothetical protein